MAQAERLEIKIGGPVEATDGPLGRVRQVVLNPGDKRVTALVVRRGTILGRDVVVPIDAIAEVRNDKVRLKLSSAEALAQPGLQSENYMAPATAAGEYQPGQALFSLVGRPLGEVRASQGLAGDASALVRAGQRVECTDGYAGKVDLVLLDGATGGATHLVIRKGALRRKDVMVPVEWVAEFHRDYLKLGVARAALDQLREYRSDQELQWAIEEALWREEPLRDDILWYTRLQVQVHDGVVSLSGYVRSQSQRARIEDIARNVPGVLGIEDNIVADDELERQVARALDEEASTRGLQIRVFGYLGHVHLTGEVSSEPERRAAEEIASRVPGVQSVINSLSVAGVAPPWERMHWSDLRVGELVYAFATDAPIGRVEKVVIGPRSRKVVGVVIAVDLPDPAHADPVKPLEEWPKQHRAAVVGIEHIVQANQAGVHLDLTATECARLPPYDPINYPTPDPNWEVPFPYRRDDVVLDLSLVPARPHFVPVPVGVILPERDGVRGLESQAGPLILVRQGQRVSYRDGELGVVEYVLMDASSGGITHVVVRAGSSSSKEILIPVQWLGRVERDAVFVDAGPDQVTTLPEYQAPRSDADIQSEVEQRLQEVAAVAEGRADVKTEVHQGVVILKGRVPSDADRTAVEHAARAAAGGREVQSHITSDETLERTATEALSRDGRTGSQASGITVEATRGDVTLHRQAGSRQALDDAVAVVHSVPGVQSVTKDTTEAHEAGATQGSDGAQPAHGS